MSKLDQVLIIEPAQELTFIGPFHQTVSSVMTLTNPSERKVCFKIKTTAPKKYCVKPNSGVVDPKQTVQIAVSLQPFDYDPLEKNRHKFMVQSMFAPQGEINQEVLWKDAEPSELMDSKLKCVFLVPDTSSTNGLISAAAAAAAGTASDNLENRENYASFTNTAAAANSMGMGGNPISGADFAGGKGDHHVLLQPGSTSTAFSGQVNKGNSYDGGDNLKKSVDEIKRLQEEISSLRHENVQLKEEALRQKRLASSRAAAADSGSRGSSSSGSSLSGDSFTVNAMNPDANALSVTHLYVAVFILILGIITGKWIF